MLMSFDKFSSLKLVVQVWAYFDHQHRNELREGNLRNLALKAKGKVKSKLQGQQWSLSHVQVQKPLANQK